MEGNPEGWLGCALRAGEQQKQNSVGLGSPGVEDCFSVTLGGAWEEHGQPQYGWVPSLSSSLWRTFSRAPRLTPCVLHGAATFGGI